MVYVHILYTPLNGCRYIPTSRFKAHRLMSLCPCPSIVAMVEYAQVFFSIVAFCTTNDNFEVVFCEASSLIFSIEECHRSH